jgi:hypothetical protein
MLDIILWIAQVLLALGFLAVGYNHAFNAAKMQAIHGMQWIGAVPRRLMTFIGLCEMAGGGVVAPALTGIQSWLTSLAAGQLAVVMLLAFVFHVVRREYPNLAINIVLLLLAVFVAYGRTVLLPFGG